MDKGLKAKFEEIRRESAKRGAALLDLPMKVYEKLYSCEIDQLYESNGSLDYFAVKKIRDLRHYLECKSGTRDPTEEMSDGDLEYLNDKIEKYEKELGI